MKAQSILSLPLPQKAGDSRFIGNISGAALALSIAELAESHQGPLLAVVPDTQSALRLQPEVGQFTQKHVTVFPDWETLPYDNFSPHQDIISERLSCLYGLPQQKDGVVLVPISTLLQRLSPRAFIQQHALLVSNGDRLSLEKLRLQLENAGYRHVDQVMEHGEYASRGSLLDLFPMGSNQPFRIDFFDDEVDSIRQFDPENQRSTGEIEQIRLLPAHEFPTDELAIESFRMRWREQFEARREPESIYQQVSKRTWPAGIEYWQPLFFEHTETLFDYLPDNSLLITIGQLEPAVDQFLNDAEYRYDQRRVDPLRPLLPPKDLWLSKEEMFTHFKQLPQVRIRKDAEPEKAGRFNPALSPVPALTINHQLKEPLAELRRFIEQFSGKIIFSVASEAVVKPCWICWRVSNCARWCVPH